MADLIDLPSWKLSTADLIQQVLISTLRPTVSARP